MRCLKHALIALSWIASRWIARHGSVRHRIARHAIVRPWFVSNGLMALLVLAVSSASPAAALKPITINGDAERVEITNLGDLHEGKGDSLQIETATGIDGAAGRMGVRGSTLGTNPNWLVFALTNPTDKTIELWLTADRYNVVGSGVISPDLDARRIETVSNSSGFAPERIKSDRSDIFRLTIERGQTITYVAELASDRFARVYLWKPLDYEQKQRDRQLFNGIMLGVVGLLAVFLTAVFAANHKVIFPSAALVTWCALALLCVDFGFWHKLFQMRPEDNAQYRAATEAALAASLVIFMFTFLRVNLWHGLARMLFLLWMAAQVAVVVLSVLDPKLAATIARLSLPVIGLLGTATMLYLALRGLDRALALIPTWIMFLVWMLGAGTALTGRLAGDFVTSGLVAGLVLIVVLIGFTVTQFAFRSSEPTYGASSSQQQLRLAAIDRAGVAVWEWNARRDEIRLDTEVELTLGLSGGELPTKVDEFVAYLHPADKERFILSLAGIKERAGGALRQELRLRHADSSYRWFDIEGGAVPTTDHRQLRCVGLVRDITDEKRAQERLIHDAVHDSLTGLPNRGIFFDRLNSMINRVTADPKSRPTVFFFDIDKFRSVNSSFGLIVGDSILLTIARRLSRNLDAQDTLARISGDQFALLTVGQQDVNALAVQAERLRLALRSPIRIAGQEIILTCSIGVALADGTQADGRDLLREAETAMFRAKRAGSDRIEIFRPEMRGEKDARVAVESDLRRAIDAGELTILYQPIVALSNEELVGFEALVRWQHPKLGLLSPAEFIPIAEETDLIVQLGSFVLNRAVKDIARWQKELPRPGQPLFVSVNVSSRQLIKPDLVQEIRHLMGGAALQSDTLRLEITESLVMENPEQASHILDLLKDAGVHLSLDDFGTGYSSLAYLNRFPFDTIKIDKALVQSSSDDENGGIIVRSIVALAHELGKKIVAEGIETPEDAAFLRSLGCQHAQGFHYGVPMAEGDVSRLLKLIRKADRRMRRKGLVHGAEKKRPAEAAIAANHAAGPNAGANGAAPNASVPAATVPATGGQAATGQRPTPAGAGVPASRPGSAPPQRPPQQNPANFNAPSQPMPAVAARAPQSHGSVNGHGNGPSNGQPNGMPNGMPMQQPPQRPAPLSHQIAARAPAAPQMEVQISAPIPAHRPAMPTAPSGRFDGAPTVALGTIDRMLGAQAAVARSASDPAAPTATATGAPNAPVYAAPAGQDSAIDRMLGAHARGPSHQSLEQANLSQTAPADPVQAERTVPPMRRPLRRANLDALPPGIAARLAKLAGKSNGQASGGPAGANDADAAATPIAADVGKTAAE